MWFADFQPNCLPWKCGAWGRGSDGFGFSSQEKDDSMEDMIKKKMQKINDYREKLKKKSVTFSRNIKKEHESMQKRVSSKTESGIAGSSTRESQS